MSDAKFYVVEIEQSTYRGSGSRVKWKPLDQEKLKSSLAEMAGYLSDAMSPLAAGFRDFHPSEIEVGLQVSAEGSVGFLGTGASTEGSASIKIKFSRTT